MKDKFPEEFRKRTHLPWLAYEIPHYRIADYWLNCVVSSGLGWEHVSVTIGCSKRRVERCQTWEEMCFVKEMFWYGNEAVIQFHPDLKDYVNNHPYCLHLWRPTDGIFPTPDSEMVGIKSKNL